MSETISISQYPESQVIQDELQAFKAILEANGIDSTPQALKTHLEQNNLAKELLELEQIRLLQAQSDMPKPPIPIAVVNGQLGFLSFSKLAFEAYQQELIGYVAGLKKEEGNA
jgi:hypothetical protein